MPKKAMLVLTASMFYILMALHKTEMCGQEITDYISLITDGRIVIGPATLYTILAKFLKEQLIEETKAEGRKRTYRITDKGEEAYSRELERLRQCILDAEGSERSERTEEMAAVPVL